MGDVSIVGNNASAGGGVYAYSAAASLVNASLRGNTASSGAGIYFVSPLTGDLALTNVSIAGNAATSSAGGMYIYGRAVLQNVAVVGNSALSGGGALLYATGYGDVLLDGVVLTDNVANYGGGIYGYGSNVVFQYCDVWGNLPSDFSGMANPTGILGNVCEPPGFLDTSPADPAEWDLHLGPGSPLIDQGNPASFDPDGSRADMGAYGGPYADAWDLDGDGYPLWWQPGDYDHATYPAHGWDCDDSDPDVFPGCGC